MNNTTIGILAHVDAGKTTLSESILFRAGAIRRRGRVDHGDAFLDTDEMEKKRGITIYSKLARFRYAGRPFTILDTPGHADFSPEMERALRVLDAAVLVVSAADLTAQSGADPQVMTLWRLLAHYRVPAIVFINKMDQQREDSWAEAGAEETALRQRLLSLLQKDLGEGLVPFDARQLCRENEEAVAVCDDDLMERVMEGECVTDEDVTGLIAGRRLYPVYFGSALRDEGVDALLEGIARYAEAPLPGAPGDASSPGQGEQAFGAIVYKITREDGVRLTWMKITSGVLSIRDSVRQELPAFPDAALYAAEGVPEDAPGEDDAAQDIRQIQEKITELRLYSGSRFTAVTSVGAGEIAAAAGLSYTRAGDGLGVMEASREELLTPIMTSRVTAEDLYGRKADDFTLMKALRGLAEQEPVLQPERSEETGDITVRIMGEVQTGILKEQLQERYGLRAQFGPGTIVYRETIRRPVEGVGHFEPLRHYAEVHLLLEPGEPGSGIVLEDACPPDTLERSWRNLILTHLAEKEHKGVLTGSALTDVRIRVIGGRASRKHTSGGDFRKATYSAVRQGLMSAENILLEPVLSLRMELPPEQIGRAMSDIARMSGRVRPAEIQGEYAVLEGSAPASEFGDYAQTLAGYTGGRGQISVSLKGYEPCHNAREVIDRIDYDPDADRRNVSSSVFCSHGAGTTVPWDRVREFMHVDTGWTAPTEGGPYLTDDYYIFTGESTELFEIDRADEERPSRKEGTGLSAFGSLPGAEGRSGAEGAADKDSGPDAGARIRMGEGPGMRSGMPGGSRTGTSGGPADHSARRRNPDDFKKRQQAFYAGEAELERIFERTYGPVRRNLHHPENEKYYMEKPAGGKLETAGAGPDGDAASGGDPSKRQRHAAKVRQEPLQEYLLVDGYNIIYAWQDLKDLAAVNIASARGRLLDILSDYAGYSGRIIIVVFDAYRVPGGRGEILRYHNIDVVYTREAETADLYIEKTAHKLAKNHRVTVATGDYVEQVIIFGAGALRMSPRGLLEAILHARQELRDRYLDRE